MEELEFFPRGRVLALLKFFLFFPLFHLAQAAPIPGTSSSALVSPLSGLYRSELGFELRGSETNWSQIPVPEKSRFIAVIYQSPQTKNHVRASLSVRVDRLKNKTNLRGYVGRWLKEYPKYGYNVLGSRPFKTQGHDGYVIDLMSDEKKRQLRQVIYFKNQLAILMTCRDQIESFQESLTDCNKIMKSFRWTQNREESKKQDGKQKEGKKAKTESTEKIM